MCRGSASFSCGGAAAGRSASSATPERGSSRPFGTGNEIGRGEGDQWQFYFKLELTGMITVPAHRGLTVQSGCVLQDFCANLGITSGFNSRFFLF